MENISPGHSPLQVQAETLTEDIFRNFKLVTHEYPI